MRLAALVATLSICSAPACSAAECAGEYEYVDGACVVSGGTGGTGGVPIGECSPACGDHASCDGSVVPNVCRCVAGYEGDPCEWAEVPLDPGFEQEGGWTRTGGATIVKEGRGVAYFPPGAVCSAARVSQRVEMPSYESADPLVAEVTYRARPQASIIGLDVGFDRAWKTLLPTLEDEWQTKRICLGEAAYGGMIDFQLSGSEPHPDCLDDPMGTIEVDHFQVQLANPGECPEPGTALNGMAEVDANGWVFQELVTTGEGPGEASLVADAGRAGGGARLYRPAGTGWDQLGMSTQVSVPLPGTAGPPALRLWWKASANESSFFSVDFGTSGFEFDIPRPKNDRLIRRLYGDGRAHEDTFCLPPWTFGNVIELSFATTLFRDPAEPVELVVDDIEVVRDPRCGDSTELFDPGFDSAPNLWPGAIVYDPSGALGVTEDADVARTGRGVFEFTYSNNKPYLTMETWVLVPASQGGEGPQLVFWSLVPPDAQANVRWLVGLGGDVKGDVPASPIWTRNPVCLPPAWSDRWFRIQVQLFPADGDLITFDSPKRVLLDDFELTTDLECPAE